MLIDKYWTLFLDRDGVINYENPDGYIYAPSEFVFYEEFPATIKILSEVFPLIIVATNQRGVGKGLMTEKDLSDIHAKMLHDTQTAGGRIDKVYVCTSL
ncbi:MAG TPA: histidinol phosphate phosphatase, partial [Puia sp.]|nr:histidinol phosphate phosphatase [Puia sp.]